MGFPINVLFIWDELGTNLLRFRVNSSRLLGLILISQVINVFKCSKTLLYITSILTLITASLHDR
jgi:hypothetical protein